MLEILILLYYLLKDLSIPNVFKELSMIKNLGNVLNVGKYLAVISVHLKDVYNVYSKMEDNVRYSIITIAGNDYIYP